VRHFSGLTEIIGDETCAPRRWTAAPQEPVAIRFAVHRDRAPAVAAVRYTTRPPGSAPRTATAELEPPVVSAGAGDYQVFRAELPPLNREGAYAYRIGYATPQGAWRWSPVTRTVVVTSAPRRFDDLRQPFLGWVDGVAVTGPAPARPLTPAPADWRRRLFYSLLIDRFAVGTPERQGLGFVRFNPACPFSAHGGDLTGIQAQLDYLSELGVGALILSPLYLNAADGYHGYHPLHLLAMDPRYGDLAGMRALVAGAHARGIAVLLDVLVNHLADVMAWRRTPAGYRGRFHFDDGELTPPPLPVELSDPGFFHDPGGTGLIETPLFGFLADWRTEHSYVRKHLIAHLKYWIAETGIDGFRFDAVRHVELDFWQGCLAELQRYCRAVGKADFLFIGEHAGHLSGDVGYYSRSAGFSGMIDYPLYYRLQAIFAAGTADLRSLKGYFDQEIFAYRDSRYNLAFLDNQDTSRFRHFTEIQAGDSDAACRRHLCALALLILGPGLPCLYYGTEQEFAGAHITRHGARGERVGYDCHVREDMFPNPYCIGPAGPVNRPRHPPYDRSNPTFQAIRRLAGLRAAEPALWQGDRYGVIDGEPWLLAYFMWAEAAGALVLVVIHFAGQTAHRQLDLAHAAPALPAAARRRLLAAPQGEILFRDGPFEVAKTGPMLALTCGPESIGVVRFAG